MSCGYRRAIGKVVPDAEICFDPWMRRGVLPVRAGVRSRRLAVAADR